MFVMSGDTNVIKREVMKILRYKNVTLEVLRMRNLKTKVITCNGRDNCNHLKTTQTIPEKQIGRA